MPQFGQVLALDGKALASYARGPKREQQEQPEPDGRRDLDADWGRKVYRGKKEDGSTWEKVVSWFGYRLHLVVDATYELPVGFTVTKASISEVKEAPKLLDKYRRENAPDLGKVQVLFRGSRL
ncbi:MAG: transposase [Bacillota bacterium]